MKRLLPRAIITFMLACIVVPSIAQSNEAAIRKLFDEKLGGNIESVSKSPIPGIYEVVSEGMITYVDEKANYFIAGGNLVDVKTMKNLTAERRAELMDKKLAKLSPENAIKHVRGNGKNVLITFEDPNCGYCKKLWKEIKQLDNVTVYTYLIAILSEDSNDKSKAIWCAGDRNKSWSDWMMNGVVPVAAAGGKCDAQSVLEKNLKLSQSLGVRGTPFLYFPATKQQVGGFISAAEIQKAFAKAGG